MVISLVTMFYAASVVFTFTYKHMLMMLLSIEYVVLGMFMMYVISMPKNNLFYSFIFTVFTACEGVLGLSLMVSSSRVYGADYFFIMNNS